MFVFRNLKGEGCLAVRQNFRLLPADLWMQIFRLSLWDIHHFCILLAAHAEMAVVSDRELLLDFSHQSAKPDKKTEYRYDCVAEKLVLNLLICLRLHPSHS